MALRVAYARIMQESHPLSPVLTEMEEFRAIHFVEGEALAKVSGRFGYEIQGFLRHAELSGFVASARRANVTPVPLFSALSIPGGPVSQPCFDELRDRLVDGLRRAGPLDGLFLALHGAMSADGISDPDSKLIEAARSVMGDRPIAVTHDLHGNITRDRMASADILCAYHTNPHRDHAATAKRATDLLVRTLRHEIEPVMAWRSLPMMLGGGTNLDFMQPLRALFQRVRAAPKLPGMLDASMFTVHPFNCHPELGWSSVAIADGDVKVAEDFADSLAEAMWEARKPLPPTFMDVGDAVARAKRSTIARKLGCVILADTSDVVTAGAPGENTAILATLLSDAPELRSYVPLRDPELARELFGKPVGTEVTVDVGGKLDPTRSKSLRVTGKVRTSHTHESLRKMVVLDVGKVSVVLTEGPAAALSPSFYTCVGLDPMRADVVVVKTYFPFLLYFLPYYRKVYFVKTSGVTDWEAVHPFPFDGPIWPRDEVTAWRPTDQRRRRVERTTTKATNGFSEVGPT